MQPGLELQPQDYKTLTTEIQQPQFYYSLFYFIYLFIHLFIVCLG